MSEKYFLVPYRTNVTLEKLPEGTTEPDMEEFSRSIPAVSAISGNLEKLDIVSAKALRKYGREFSRLVDHQTRIVEKINNIIGYLLTREDDSKFQTIKLSGSGFIVPQEALPGCNPDEQIHFRLFLKEYGIFICGFGKVVSCYQLDNQSLAEVEFTRIMEKDREMIIQAMTQEQQKKLQQRNNEKANQS